MYAEQDLHTLQLRDDYMLRTTRDQLVCVPPHAVHNGGQVGQLIVNWTRKRLAYIDINKTIHFYIACLKTLFY